MPAVTDVMPNSIAQPGQMKDQALVGRVVSKKVREIFQNTMGSGRAGGKVGGKDKGKGKGKGKASGKDKGKSKAKGKADVTKVLEVNLSGGDSGADVILFEVYDQSQGHERIAEFDAVMQEKQPVRLTKAQVLAHTEKTRPYTTSRLDFYLKAVPATKAEPVADGTLLSHVADWHPLTSLKALHRLADRSLVCVAGVLLPPVPVMKQVPVEKDGSKEEVDVSNAKLKCGTDIIQLSFWRQHADQLTGFSVGRVLYIEAGMKAFHAEKGLAIRAGTRTVVSYAPQALEEIV